MNLVDMLDERAAEMPDHPAMSEVVGGCIRRLTFGELAKKVRGGAGDLMRRFILHEHSGHGPTHWDLMIQSHQALATWQFAEDPAAQPAGVQPCVRLADHREAYLDYEGPVSGSRGAVRAVDRGMARVLDDSPQRWEVELQGRRLPSGRRWGGRLYSRP